MTKLGLAAGLLALLVSSARAGAPAFDTTDWISFKVEDARLAQQIIAAFPAEPDYSQVIGGLKLAKDAVDNLEAKVRSAALRERLAIAQAKVQGTIAPEEADAELTRLAKALEIHLCYIYGNEVPRIYDGAFGPYASDSLKAAFQVRLKREDYLALLRQDPMQGNWEDSGTRRNLSEPMTSKSDGNN